LTGAAATPPVTGAATPADGYRDRRDRFGALRDAEARRSRALSTGRLVAFLALIGAGVWSEVRPGPPPLIVIALSAIAFIFLVVRHHRVRRRERWYETMRALDEEGLARIARDWETLPERAAPASARGHAYAGDLDLFGRPGLAQLLGPAATQPGRETLARWLLEPAAADVVRERQQAVAELAPDVDLRHTAFAHGRQAATVRSEDVEAFLRWAEGPPLRLPVAVTWAARILPVLTIAGMILDATGIIGPPLWVWPLLASAALTFSAFGSRVRRVFSEAFAKEAMFRAYPELFAVFSGATFDGPLLRRLGGGLSAEGVAAHERLRGLVRLRVMGDLRFSGTTYVPVQLLTMWDFHVLALIERWKRIAGKRVRAWLEMLGELEALAALATLAHDEPEWALPDIGDGDALAAGRLGHPMLPRAVRVDNDVTVGPPGTVLLVTGSNMSGKSTLLRAIGLNAVLALAGGPVCARAMRMPVVDLRTSIHIEDSLVRGVSFFMAQLQRMKEIVSAADASSTSNGPRVLYLLDEILQGTNTAERRIAATRVIRHLVDRGALGAVTTHDLEIATDPALIDAADPVHFTETVEGSVGEATMNFDYLLRPGVATSTNALKLMEIVGLGS
jgi:hypothetical protein